MKVTLGKRKIILRVRNMITQLHNIIVQLGLEKISSNITKEEFSDHLLFLTSTGLSERKKIAEDFFKKNNLYHDKIEFEDVYFL